MSTRVIIYYTILCLVWGTTWFAMKISLNYGTPPLFGAGIRFFIAGIILTSILLIRKERLPLNRRAVTLYIQFGLLNFAISYSLTYWATQYIYSNITSLVWAGFPVAVSLFSQRMLPDDKMTPPKFISIVVGVVGVSLIILNGPSLGGENVVLGLTAVAAAVFVAAYSNVYLKKYHTTVTTLQLNTAGQSLAGLVLLILSFLLEDRSAIIWSSQNIAALTYLTLFGSVMTWLIYFWLFQHLSMTQISYVALFPPVIATLVGWIFLDERLTPVMLIGAGLVLAGGLMIQRLPAAGNKGNDLKYE